MKKDETEAIFKDTFIVRTEWRDSIMRLNNDQRGELFTMMLDFHCGENAQTCDFAIGIIWDLIRPNLIRNIASYDKRRETSKINGLKGGRPPKEEPNNNLNKPNEKPKKSGKPKKTLSVSVSDSDSVSGNVSGNVNVKEKEKSDLRKRKISAFDKFWNTYGLKQDRKKCMNKFIKLSEQDIEQIDAYLKNVYFPHLKQNHWLKKRNPLTFLNSEDWKEMEKIDAQDKSKPLYETETINGKVYELRINPGDNETRERKSEGSDVWAIDTNFEERRKNDKL